MNTPVQPITMTREDALKFVDMCNMYKLSEIHTLRKHTINAHHRYAVESMAHVAAETLRQFADLLEKE